MGSRSYYIAKKKLKTHIAKYANQDNFEPTIQKASYWFGVINRAAFGNKLPLTEINIKRLKKAWGLCWVNVDKTYTIEISSSIKSRELFLGTLGHEMVHMWQEENEGTMNHTDSFKWWVQYFKCNFGIDI